MTSHVLGSSVQIPEGQSEAPSAEHCPSQLTPWPQVTTLGVLSGVQQVTLLTLLENVKALSKKSTEGAGVVVVALSPGKHDLNSQIFSTDRCSNMRTSFLYAIAIPSIYCQSVSGSVSG